MNYSKLIDKLDMQKSWFEEHFSSNQTETGWNSSEIINHFISIEIIGINSFKEYSNKSKKIGLKESFNSFLLNSALRLPLKFPAPKRVSSMNSDTSKDELFQNWIKTRTDLIEIINSYPSEKRKHSFFNHPKAGLISLSNYLKFLYLHHNHHKNQFLKK